MSALLFSPFSDEYTYIEHSTWTSHKFDVFISHKSSDLQACIRIAERLRDIHRLKVYLDALDLLVSSDDPNLEKYLRNIIRNSHSLLAAVSEQTRASWWVPFEIATALENSKLVGTQLLLPNNQIKLPTYLRNWPIFPSWDTGGLDEWVRMIKQPSRVHRSYYIKKQKSQTSNLSGIEWIID